MADLQNLKCEVLILAGYLAVGEQATASNMQANLHTLVTRICADVHVQPMQIASIAAVLAAAIDQDYG